MSGTTIDSARRIYFTVATAGHVDHGKTSLLRALTGIDPDRLKEEKQRQMTIDLGFAHLSLPSEGSGDEYVVGFIDVPGHGKFLKNMLAGVGGIEMALLVVAADEGPMPQTVAHVKILSLLGVKKVIVILTKIDLVNDSRRDDALARTAELLSRFEIETMSVVHFAAPDGRGVSELKSALRDALSSVICDVTLDGAPVYLPIDRVFSKAGYGLVVTGTLVRGKVNVGDNLFVEPGGLKARVRGLETFGCSLQAAEAGQRLAVNLTFKENAALERGQAILGQDIAPCKTLIVKLTRTNDGDDRNLQKDLSGQQVRFYHGTSESHGEVRWVEQLDQFLIGQVTLHEPVVVEPRDRFILRFGEEGITGGEIVCTARPRWLTRPKLFEVSTALLERDDIKAVALFLDACPQRTVRVAALDAIFSQVDKVKIVESVVSAGTAVRLAEYVCTQESIGVLSAKFLKEIGDGKQDGKQSSLETIRSKVLPGIDRAAFQALVRVLVDSGKVKKHGDQLLPSGAELPSPEANPHAALAEKLHSILLLHYCLEIDELVVQSGKSKPEVLAAIQYLGKQFRAVVVNYDFAAATEKLNEAHKFLAEIWVKKKDISPADFRDAIGSTRKYAMAILAHFDHSGVTRRLNNSRVLLKNPKAQ